MGSTLWNRLIRIIAQIDMDMPKLDKKNNKLAQLRIRRNVWKAMKLLRAIGGLANEV